MVTKKETETKDLIANLTEDMSEVRVLPSPLKRATFWSVVSIALITVVTIALMYMHKGLSLQNLPLFDNNPNSIDQKLSVLECLSFILIGFASLFACFKLSIPDIEHSRLSFILLGIATGFLALTTLLSFTNSDSLVMHEELTHGGDHLCIEGLGAIIALPALFIYRILKRTAPTLPAWTGYAALLGVVSFGTVAMRYLCSTETYAHLFLHHFAPAMVLSFFGLLIGKLFLRW